MEPIIKAFKQFFMPALAQYATFSGKENRQSYWMFYLFYIVVLVALNIVESIVGGMWLSSLYMLAMFIPTLSMGARRLHDTGRSGWWQLIALLPLIGIIVLIVFLAQESKPAESASAVTV